MLVDQLSPTGGGSSPVGNRAATFIGIVVLGLASVNVTAGTASPGLAGFAIMWVPAVAALLTTLLYRDPWRRFGWKLGEWKYLGIAYVMPFFYVAVPFAIALLLGSGQLTMEWWPMAAGHLGLPATPLSGFLMLATLNVLVAMISALGEELGWRGYLVPLLAGRFQFWFVVAISWAVWTGFHLPGLLSGGYGATGVPLWSATLNFALLLLPLSVMMTWLRLRSESIWPCVLAHGAHNAFVGEMFASAMIPDASTPWLFGEFSLLMPVIAAITVFLAIKLAGERRQRSRTTGATPHFAPEQRA